MKARFTTSIPWPARRVLWPLLAAACTRSPPPPTLTGVAPAVAFTDAPTDIVITGEGFWPRMSVDARGPDRDELLGGYAVDLTGPAGTFALDAVNREGLDVLAAEVPAGLPVGLYDLVVRTPFATTATLPDALDVLDERADALDLRAGALQAVAGEPLSVDLFLLDPVGRPLAQDRAVRIDVSGVPEGATVTFAPGGLEGQITGPASLGLLGRLGDDGYAQVTLTVSAPTTLTVIAAPSNEGDPVDGDDLQLLFTSGEAARAEVALVDPPVIVEAGQRVDAILTMVDDQGNIIPDYRGSVTVIDTCFGGDFVNVTAVPGPTAISYVPRRATGSPGCDVIRLSAKATGLPGEALSEPFVVLPGPVQGYEVDVFESVVVAGDTISLRVTPVDRFFNEVDVPASIAVIEQDGAVVPAFSCVGNACTATVTRAGAVTTVRVLDDAARQGTSAAFTVLPAAPVTARVVPGASTWVAGAWETVRVELLDAWGNVADGGALPPEVSAATAAGQPAECVITGQDAAAVELACRLFTAGVDERLRLVLGGAIPVEAAPVAVVNGPLANLAVTPARTDAVAGEGIGVTVRATDAWGNPWVVQDDPTLTLSAAAGPVTPATIDVDVDGVARATFWLTRAGPQALLATSAEGVVGQSPPILIRPGPAAAMRVRLGQPWAMVGDDLTVSVDILDVWDNQADVSDRAEVSARGPLAGPFEVFIRNGTGSAALRWTAPVPSELLDVRTTTLAATSPPFPVVMTCVDGPTAELFYGAGRSFGAACRDASGQATLPIVIAADPGPTSAMVGYAVEVDGLDGAATPSPAATAVFDTTGIFPLRALAIRGDGCAVELRDHVFVGDDDGTPVGPITVVWSTPTVDIGGRPVGVVIGAADCLGNALPDAEISVRVDRGRLVGATPTGSGLVVRTAATGYAAATVDLATVGTGGPVRLSAWAGDDAWGASDALVVRGDIDPPQVWDQTPRGPLGAPQAVIELELSEAIDPATVTPAAFAVQSDVGSAVIAATLVTPTRARAILDPPAPTNGDTRFQVSGLTDLAGTPLDGRFDGQGLSYVGLFGIAGEEQPTPSCGRDTERFRPDGDPGVGVEADAVQVTFTTPAAHSWWVVGVVDGDGRRIRQAQLPGAAASWAWDGRDATGRVVDAGPYTLQIQSENSAGERSPACIRSVDVDAVEGP